MTAEDPQKSVNMHEAKTNLSKLVERAEAGEDVVIARNGQPVVKLVRVEHSFPARGRGAWKNKVILHGDFDDPKLNEEIARDFYEGHPDDPLLTPPPQRRQAA